VNYYGANIPQRILDLFAPVWSVTVTEIVYSGFDAITRSLVVVLMWLVAGKLWRGVALIIADDTKEAMARLQETVTELQQRNAELEDTHKYGAMFAVMSGINQARLVDEMKKIANGQTPQLEAAAKAELPAYTRSRAKRVK
jgi:nitrate reductase NapAB chaperone NapD